MRFFVLYAMHFVTTVGRNSYLNRWAGCEHSLVQLKQRKRSEPKSARDWAVCIIQFVKTQWKTKKNMVQIKLLVIVGLITLSVESSHSASVHACGCTRDYRPVCASDGRTYNNKCLFLCEKEIRDDLHIKHDGVCVPDEISLESPVDCVCTLIYSPICASNGVTYSNECHLKCAQRQKDDLKPIHDGECDLKIEHLPLEEDS